MPLHARYLPAALMLLAASTPLAAQEQVQEQIQAQMQGQAPAQEMAQVNISELRNPLSLPARAVMNAQEAFNQRRHLAPGASLQYRLLPKGVPEERALELKIESSDGERISIVPIGEDMTFALPSFLDDARYQGGRLILNRKKGQMDWWPHIRVPGDGDERVRVGTVRLECEVFWAASKGEMPLFARGMLAMVDLCASQRVQVFVPVTRPLRSATVTQGGKTWPLELGPGGWSYLAPLGEERITDDGLIQLTYGEDAPPPAKGRLSLHLGMAKAPSQLRDPIPPEPTGPTEAAPAPAEAPRAPVEAIGT